jgi:hypothetical protein
MPRPTPRAAPLHAQVLVRQDLVHTDEETGFTFLTLAVAAPVMRLAASRGAKLAFRSRSTPV